MSLYDYSPFAPYRYNGWRALQSPLSIPQDTQETNNLYLLLIAESRVHGMLVAPKTSTSLLSTPTPAIKKGKDKHIQI